MFFGDVKRENQKMKHQYYNALPAETMGESENLKPERQIMSTNIAI